MEMNGRKVKRLENKRTCWVNIRTTPEDRDMIEKIAKEQGVSMSVVCYEAVKKCYPIAFANAKISALKKVLDEYEQELQG